MTAWRRKSWRIGTTLPEETQDGGRNLKIVFMGTPDFAVATLNALEKAGYDIPLVITQPDRPKGRHGEAQKSDVRIAAENYGIPVATPECIRKDEELKARLRSIAPDAIVVTAFGQILPKDILEIPKYGCVNVHASLLPKYRGAAPVQWAVLNGDPESGVTTMQMDEGLDTGDILMVKRLPLDPKETGGSLFEKLAKLGGELIVETLEALAAGTAVRTPQNSAEATKVGLFTKTSGQIDWTTPASAIERKIRGLNPWPSAYTFLGGKQLKLWDADVLPEEALAQGELPLVSICTQARDAAPTMEADVPGCVYADAQRMILRCGEGLLEIRELQLEGKKRMKTEDFLRGHRF